MCFGGKQMSTLKLGYIGLGLMGKPMAQNLLKAGFPVVVHNRSRQKVEKLVRLGATAADNPAQVAERADIVFTNLPDTPDVLGVVLGENGVLAGAHPGMIFVDNSTIKPAASRQIYQRLAEIGVSSLDAPVSGGDIGAQQGTLSIMVGGDADALEKVMPAFMAIGKTVTHIGGPGTGQVAKACNQIMVAAQMLAMSELLIFAQKAGADPEKVVGAVRGGAAQCWTLDVKPQRLLAGNRAPGFRASLQSKDLNIVMETAREYGMSLPGAGLLAQLYAALCANGGGGLDNSGIIAVIEALNNTELKHSG
ncbi:MAG TPA: NAD(P)-binding domain-containing protein [Anaerolineaceae bacterium]|nr:NAD(P)-binding domain-containing protein [Anaerolineaceae bacterium]HOR83197.1 NAD(P)-binding domain-containing protein [Anaerolineaceae bacterium]HPL43225.1 NAD(P)-binding domain-containing protein [Anaerolineaceae bacterium]